MKRTSLLLAAMVLISCIASISLAQVGATTILKPYQWQNRLILIFADSAKSEAYIAQLESLESYPVELEDRQLKIINIFKDNTYAYSFTLNSKSNKIEKTKHLELENLETETLHNFYQTNDGFTVLLIGKDGGVKRRSNEVLDAWEFFDQIDTMPMRQREMSNQ